MRNYLVNLFGARSTTEDANDDGQNKTKEHECERDGEIGVS